MIRNLLSILGFAALFLLQPPVAARPIVLQNDEVVVVYQESFESAAEEVIRIYPKLKQELGKFFGWTLDIRPQVVLVDMVPLT